MKETYTGDLLFSGYKVHLEKREPEERKVKVINLDRRRPWTPAEKTWRCTTKLKKSSNPEQVLYGWVKNNFITIEEFSELTEYLVNLKLLREVKAMGYMGD